MHGNNFKVVKEIISLAVYMAVSQSQSPTTQISTVLNVHVSMCAQSEGIHSSCLHSVQVNCSVTHTCMSHCYWQKVTIRKKITHKQEVLQLQPTTFSSMAFTTDNVHY